MTSCCVQKEFFLDIFVLAGKKTSIHNLWLNPEKNVMHVPPPRGLHVRRLFCTSVADEL